MCEGCIFEVRQGDCLSCSKRIELKDGNLMAAFATFKSEAIKEERIGSFPLSFDEEIIFDCLSFCPKEPQTFTTKECALNVLNGEIQLKEMMKESLGLGTLKKEELEIILDTAENNMPIEAIEAIIQAVRYQ